MGKHHKKNKTIKQEMPISKNKIGQNSTLTQINLNISSESDKTITPKQFIRRSICLASIFMSPILFGFGGQAMGASSEIAPWLMALGALLVAIAIITNQDVWNFITNRLKECTLVKARILKTTIYIIFCAMLFLPVLLGFQKILYNQMANTPTFYGQLTPGNGSTPVLPSNNISYSELSPNTITLMLGDDSAVFVEDSAKFSLVSGDKTFLSIQIGSDGKAILNTVVIDSENNHVVTIKNNKFQAYKDSFWPIQPNKHTLVVNDNYGFEVLNVNYINSKVIRIVGNFYLPGISQPVVIQPDGTVIMGGQTIHHFYSYGGHDGIINIGN
jgi:hypothetical protein